MASHAINDKFTRRKLRTYIFLVRRNRKIMVLLSYHSSNLPLIALETMRLLVPNHLEINDQVAKVKKNKETFHQNSAAV